MIIAIDGPAGSGKSTVAQMVAKRLSFHYLDTGAMYRAIAFRALASGVRPYDESAVAVIAEQDQVTFEHEGNEPLPSRVLIAGDDVTRAIRMPKVEDVVSTVASMTRVREAMVSQQRRIAHECDTVVEGRDIGTVVFPDAEVKVYLTASPEERARRRAAQQAMSGMLVDPAGVRESILRRDEADSSRELSPLTPADDAILLDTTGMSIEEVVESIAQLAERARQGDAS